MTTAGTACLLSGVALLGLAIRRFLTPNGFRAALLGFSVLGSASGCTTYQPIDQSAETINRDTTDYNSLATLLNIIRASRAEPLGFFSVSGITTSDTYGTTFGLPTITFGPNLPSTPRQFVFGPNSVTRGGNNNVTFGVIDDPASYVALLAPVNPAIIGFLINQGYDRVQLFYLLVDRLRVVDKNGTATYYINNPENDDQWGAFGAKLADLLVSGLTAQVDANAVPNTRPLPASKLCFDPALPKPVFVTHLVPTHYQITCDNADWMEAPPPAALADGSGQKPAAGKSKPTAGYSFVDTQGNKVEVYLRSTYGVYQYLGQLRRANNGSGTDIDNLLDPTLRAGGLLKITSDTSDCFVQTDYRNMHYCVPNDAIYTKKTFTLLHQLVALNATPTNVPATTIVHVN